MPWAPKTFKTNNTSNRMSVDLSIHSTERMSVQAVNPWKEKRYNPLCITCGKPGHNAFKCRSGPPRDRQNQVGAMIMGGVQPPISKSGPGKMNVLAKYNRSPKGFLWILWET